MIHHTDIHWPTDDPPPSESSSEPSASTKPKLSQASRLVTCALKSGAEFFRDDDLSYLHVPVGDHHETCRLRSKYGRSWLQRLYIEHYNTCPGSQAIADAQNALEARCLEGPNQPVFVRIARTDAAIYLDLGDASWQAVEINAHGWQVIKCPPVRFRRPRKYLALPEPILDDSTLTNTLKPFVNVETDDDFLILVAELLAMLRGRGPYPVLVINGEQGSAKSTLCQVVKQLIDPRAAGGVRGAPRDERDLMIAAMHHHVLLFDNLSFLPDWLSDALSRLATGGGFATRQLYEDAEEQIFDAVRPIIVSGIPELASRPDLVSRAVFITLPTIDETKRKPEAEFWCHFDSERPAILGQLLDCVSMALRHECTVRLPTLPRMADFARWVVAAESACPWDLGQFLEVYSRNRDEAVSAILEGDRLADFVRAKAPWTGTASALLTALNEATPKTVRKGKRWFKHPRQVADALRRLAPALRRVGVEVMLDRTESARIITLERVGNTSSASSASSAPNKSGLDFHDDA
jgi:hypothetical protein